MSLFYFLEREIMIKYMTGGYKEDIEAIEIERETESSVWIDGRRRSKLSTWDIYHDTWEAARDHLMTTATHKVRNYQSRLDSVKAELSKFSKLKK